jgi:hypothetical protein
MNDKERTLTQNIYIRYKNLYFYWFLEKQVHNKECDYYIYILLQQSTFKHYVVDHRKFVYGKYANLLRIATNVITITQKQQEILPILN